MVSWILFVQTPYNKVKFLTNEDASYQVLGYFHFKDFIAQFSIKNLFEFDKNLDSFQTIFLDCTTGEWKVEKPEYKQPTFEEMLKLNPGKQEIDEDKKKKDPLLRKKNFIDNFFKARKKQANVFSTKFKK